MFFLASCVMVIGVLPDLNQVLEVVYNTAEILDL
jgi:hypothetical protein